MSSPLRLTVVLTHPIQYYAPWFRHIADRRPELALSVIYAVEPTPEQQGAGFDRAFTWDVPLREGYDSVVLERNAAKASVHSNHFRGLSAPNLERALADSRPDVVLVPGWHSTVYTRALRWCRKSQIPVLYRGDTNLLTGPFGVRRPAWIWNTRRKLDWFDAYLAVGTRAGAYLRYFGVPDHLIFDAPHVVDNAYFAATTDPHRASEGRQVARAHFGLDDNRFVVLFVGKLEGKKRLDHAVEAVTRLGHEGEPFQLIVVGSGPREREHRDRAEAMSAPVTWCGFLNQSQLGRAYGAADCLVLPSDHHETWGLVVNEALSAGIPAVVADSVGCAPDLIVPGRTGERFQSGDVDALTEAFRNVRTCLYEGRVTVDSCRQHIASFNFERLTDGVVRACHATRHVSRHREGHAQAPHKKPGLSSRSTSESRVLACCGGMVLVGGAERMTFEVLRTLREHGAAVHCIVNSWEHQRITPLADAIGATWSIGLYRDQLDRHTRNVVKLVRMGFDVARTSTGLLRDALWFAPTHVLVPDVVTAVRNLPALIGLRIYGTRVVFRLSNAPEAGRFYRFLWGKVLPLGVTEFVANSRFSVERLRETGVAADRIALTENALSHRKAAIDDDIDVVDLATRRRTILSVGQIAPFKGTHVVVDAVLRLLNRGYDLQAIVVGHTPVWPEDLVAFARTLRERVERAGAADRIHFVGARENIPAIMRASYLLAAPILQQETFGNVVLEALSVGLPVVAFANGGIPELIDDDVTGRLCDGTDVDALVSGLVPFLDDPAKRNRASQASFSRMNDPHSPFSRRRFDERWLRTFGLAETA
jgi:glycosyltransferase involved in cell wall biosynthesis